MSDDILDAVRSMCSAILTGKTKLTKDEKQRLLASLLAGGFSEREAKKLLRSVGRWSEARASLFAKQYGVSGFRSSIARARRSLKEKSLVN